MTPLKPTDPQSLCGNSHMLQDMGLIVAVQAAYLGNAA